MIEYWLLTHQNAVVEIRPQPAPGRRSKALPGLAPVADVVHGLIVLEHGNDGIIQILASAAKAGRVSIAAGWIGTMGVLLPCNSPKSCCHLLLRLQYLCCQPLPCRLVPLASGLDYPQYQSSKLFPFPGMRKLEEQRRAKGRISGSSSTPDVSILGSGV